MSAPAAGLRRELGLLALVATGVGSMVGAGINIVPFVLQRTVPGIGPWVLPAYMLAAVPAILAALCYAMLGSAMPRAGGSYVYASRALGAYGGFVASFSQWFGLCIAIGVVSYVIPPFLRDVALAASLGELAALLERGPLRVGIALGFLWLFVLVNLRGVKAVATTLVPLMFLTFGCGGLVILVGATHTSADYAAVVPPSGTPPFAASLSAILPAAAVLFSSFIGFDSIAQAGGEARNPSRNLPLAIALAVGSVGLFYFAFTWAVYHAVPWTAVSSAAQERDVTAPGLLSAVSPSPLISGIMLAGAAVSLIKDLPGMLLGVSRLCFAWATDGIFPRQIAAVHQRTGAPHVALIASATLATGAVLGGHFAGEFFLGVDILVTAMLVNFVLIAVSVLVLPTRNPDLAAKVTVLSSRRWQRVVAVAALLLLCGLLAVHTWRDLSAGSQAWYARSTPVWVIVMAIGTLIYWRETRALAARGGDLRAITAVLPPE